MMGRPFSSFVVLLVALLASNAVTAFSPSSRPPALVSLSRTNGNLYYKNDGPENHVDDVDQSTAATEKDENADGQRNSGGMTVDDIKAGAATAGIALLLAAASVSVLSTLLTALGNEIVHEAGNVAHFAGSAAKFAGGAAVEGVKVVVPAVGRAGMAGVQALAPVVGDAVGKASQAVGEAASPYIEDATRAASEQVSEAVAPLVAPVVDAVDSTIKGATDSVTSAVDATIVAPIKGATDTVVDTVTNAVDATIVSPIKDVKDAVVGAVDSTISGATESVTMTIKGAADEAGKSIKDAMPF